MRRSHLRLGIRLARRELRRRPWRTALVLLMVLIPSARDDPRSSSRSAPASGTPRTSSGHRSDESTSAPSRCDMNPLSQAELDALLDGLPARYPHAGVALDARPCEDGGSPHLRRRVRHEHRRSPQRGPVRCTDRAAPRAPARRWSSRPSWPTTSMSRWGTASTSTGWTETCGWSASCGRTAPTGPRSSETTWWVRTVRRSPSSGPSPTFPRPISGSGSTSQTTSIPSWSWSRPTSTVWSSSGRARVTTVARACSGCTWAAEWG